MATRPQQQRNLGRLSEIAQVAVRHGFGYFFERHRLTDLLPWHEKLAPMRDGEGSERGRHLREMLDELGPTFVKFGQLLSTRPDVVPPDIIVELRALQDDVRACSPSSSSTACSSRTSTATSTRSSSAASSRT